MITDAEVLKELQRFREWRKAHPEHHSGGTIHIKEVAIYVVERLQ